MTKKYENYTAGEWIEAKDQIIGEDGCVIFRATENGLDKSQHRANIQRVVACVNAFNGIDTEQIAGKNLGEFLAGEVKLNKAEPKPDGSFGFTFSGFAIQSMAESFANQFRESGAINYLEMLFEHKDIGPLTITMQRTQGLTPVQKLSKAEAERDVLQADYDKLAASFSTLMEQLAITNEAVSRETKLANQYRDKCDKLVAQIAELKDDAVPVVSSDDCPCGDSHYVSGLKDGWNYCHDGNVQGHIYAIERFQKDIRGSRKERENARSEVKSADGEGD
ncbi:hypothetical protein [Rouxiella badensis]|uniref:hypothetical protein n=1 Tax=Rouxiella badensis TaxID=1646377 RepID=UPI003C4B9846